MKWQKELRKQAYLCPAYGNRASLDTVGDYCWLSPGADPNHPSECHSVVQCTGVLKAGESTVPRWGPMLRSVNQLPRG